MTRIETSQAGVASQLEQGFGLDTSGIRGSLSAPGLGVLPPVSSSANQFARLSQALGLAGQVAETAGVIERRRKANERTNTDSAAAKAQEGLAKFHFDADRENLKNAIRNGEFDAFLSDDPDELRSNIHEWIGAQVEGHEEPYRKKANELLTVFLSTELAKREQTLLNLALEEDGNLIRDAATTETTKEGLQEAVQSFLTLHPEATETDALNRIILPQLQSLPKIAAEATDLDELQKLADRFVLLRETLDGRLATETQEAAAAFVKSARQARNQIQDQAINAIFRSRLDGDSFDKQREHVANAFHDKLLDERAASQQIDRINREEEAIKRDRLKQIAQDQEIEFRESVTNDALQIMLDARSTGGAAQIPNEVSVTLADGREVSLSHEQIMDLVVPRAMALLEEQAGSPEAAFPLQIAFLNDNNLVFDPWKRTLGAGRAAVDLINLRTSPGESGDAIPRAAMDGLLTYERMVEAGAMKLAKRHVPDDETLSFYQMARAVRRHVDSDPQQALRITVSAIQGIQQQGGVALGSDGLTQIDTEIRKFRKGRDNNPFTGTSVRNNNQIEATARNVARVFMGLGLSPKEAVKQAAEEMKDDFVVVNEWAVFNRDQRLPENLNEVFDVITDSYLERFPSAGMKKKNLSLRNTGGDVWELIDATTGIPVLFGREQGVRSKDFQFTDNRVSAGVFTTQSLNDLAFMMQRSRSEDARTRAQKAAQRSAERARKRRETTHQSLQMDFFPRVGGGGPDGLRQVRVGDSFLPADDKDPE